MKTYDVDLRRIRVELIMLYDAMAAVLGVAALFSVAFNLVLLAVLSALAMVSCFARMRALLCGIGTGGQP